jgi:hypothetical protein
MAASMAASISEEISQSVSQILVLTKRELTIVLAVRAGEFDNPCPPEVGLRFARLMDMIRTSADSGRLVRAQS